MKSMRVNFKVGHHFRKPIFWKKIDFLKLIFLDYLSIEDYLAKRIILIAQAVQKFRRFFQPLLDASETETEGFWYHGICYLIINVSQNAYYVILVCFSSFSSASHFLSSLKNSTGGLRGDTAHSVYFARVRVAFASVSRVLFRALFEHRAFSAIHSRKKSVYSMKYEKHGHYTTMACLTSVCCCVRKAARNSGGDAKQARKKKSVHQLAQKETVPLPRRAQAKSLVDFRHFWCFFIT